jgi:ankyrin repeat protein
MFPSANGHEAIVKLLLTAGADVNTKTNNGTTALMIALELKHDAIVKLLNRYTYARAYWRENTHAYFPNIKKECISTILTLWDNNFIGEVSNVSIIQELPLELIYEIVKELVS